MNTPAPAQAREARQRVIKRVVAVVKTARQLPTPPIIISRLTETLADPNYKTMDLVRIVEMDAGLATDALHLANSAAFARGNPVESVQRAVEVIGERRLGKLLMARAASAMQGQPLTGYDVGDGGLWTHSIELAIAAEAIARRVTEVAWSRAYTVALLMDMGKLALGQYVQEHRDEIRASGNARDLALLEHAVLGIDHAELGARLAWSWGLPSAIQEGVRYHHRPSEAPEAQRTLCYVVHLADIVSRRLGRAGGFDDLDYAEDKGWAEALGLPTSALASLAEEVDGAVTEALATLSL